MKSHIETRKQTITVRDEDIEVTMPVRIDDETNEMLSDMELDRQSINKAFDIYRNEHEIVSAKEIIELRTKLGVSQRTLAKLSGIGSASITRYERGSLPSNSANLILKKMIDDHEFVEQLFNANIGELNPKEIEEINHSLDDNSNSDVINLYIKRNNGNSATIENGFSKFNFTKFKNMIIFFITHNSTMSRTRLNKLLFYADFANFKMQTVSISGVTYIHDHHGPVPKDFSFIYTELEDEKTIRCEPFEGSNGFNIKTDDDFDSTIFSDGELTVLKNINEKFKNWNSPQIENYSHEEEGYKNTELKSPISYEYAFSIK